MARNDELASKLFENGEQLTAAITIQRAPADLYEMWRGFSGLASCVPGLRNASLGDGGTVSFETVDESGAGSWNAEILKEEPDRMVAWRSTGTPSIPNAGSVTLRELPFGRGTEVRVVIDYIPPKGALRQRLDKALGRDPRKALQLTLFRIRQLMEAGELASTKGQPAGRGSGRDEQGSGDEQKFEKMESKS